MSLSRAAPPFAPPGQDGDEFWSRLLDALPDAVAVIDGEGALQWANHTAEQLFGRSIHDSVGLSGLELVHPEDLEFVLLSLETVQDKEVGTPIEIRLATATGWRLVELIGSSIPWFGEGAVLIGLRDLTERRRFELAHDQDARFRSLVQNSAVVTMLLSPDGVVESVSGALTRMLGHDPELVEGRPLTRLVDEADGPALARALDSASRGALGVQSGHRHRGPAAPGRDGVGPLRADHRQPHRRPDGGRLRGLGPRRHRPGGRRARAPRHPVASHRHPGRHGRRHPGGRCRGTGSPASTAGSPTCGACPTRCSRPATMPPPSPSSASSWSSPESFVTRIEEGSHDPDSEIYDVLRFHDGRVFEQCSMPQRVDGEVVGRVWSFRDVTDRKQLEERLSHQAFHDSLTGLGNRALFQDRLDHAVARTGRTGEPAGRALPRPGQLQERQRRPRPLGRRRPAAVHGRDPGRLPAQDRHRGPTGRRRVRHHRGGDHRP